MLTEYVTFAYVVTLAVLTTGAVAALLLARYNRKRRRPLLLLGTGLAAAIVALKIHARLLASREESTDEASGVAAASLGAIGAVDPQQSEPSVLETCGVVVEEVCHIVVLCCKAH